MDGVIVLIGEVELRDKQGIWEMTRNCRKVIMCMQEYDGLTQSEVSKVTKLNVRTARKWLDFLVNEGSLEVYRQQYRPNITSRVYVKAGYPYGA